MGMDYAVRLALSAWLVYVAIADWRTLEVTKMRKTPKVLREQRFVFTTHTFAVKVPGRL